MRIGNQDNALDRTRGGDTANDTPRAPGPPDEAAARAGREDAIEISTRARALHQADHDSRAAGGASVDKAAGAAPQIDAERLAVVRERLASGYYETQSVTEAVAQRLLELLGLAVRDVAPAPRAGEGE